MADDRYPEEVLDGDSDDGTMVDNVDTLRQAVIGRRIVKAENERVDMGRWYGVQPAFVITLDDGTRVKMADTSDCCAFTELDGFLLHPERVDHMILGVGTTDGYERWHIYADLGDVLELTVGWSSGNPFYYGYGFHIDVEPLAAADG